ncbi:DEAD/DEAH box helicase [Haladaptatus sp. AB643]|uniref:DEAD/DEAH box helicase n=1 Tax=Haladaptatus sp. AB643 TaxID=2934174 RepID=UPI00209C0976|nr:DEAD/DEAH box helicase [Haladaptatus sp. AB643]MCO8242978.1 DEAD/DEAH box helicase [Haladaptatus sp. AB643]
MSAITNHPHLDAVEDIWEDLSESHTARIEQEVLRWIDQRCKKQINGGNYDSSVSLKDIQEQFLKKFVWGDADIRVTYAFPSNVDNELGGKLLFQCVIDELEKRDVLLYVYDKQRVRSRVAEITRYFALLRQRFDDNSDFEFNPSLTKMVKMDIQSREKPKWGGDGIELDQEVRKLMEDMKSADPAPELLAGNTHGDWRRAARDALQLLLEFCDAEDMTGLAEFQGRSLKQLFRQAVTTEDQDTAHVITASTGGGKTEAFLFPIFAYAFTAAHDSISLDGVDAVLAYPRTDLCNNQFERIVKYLYRFELLLSGDGDRSPDYPADELPLSVGLNHSSTSNVSFDCPHPGCDGRMSTEEFVCDSENEHEVSFAETDSRKTADIIVVTPDTLHRRLMDEKGESQYWRRDSPPKFIVLDEVHVYTNQYGMHVANVMRRFQQAMKSVSPNQSPSLVASSATISNAEEFTKQIFGTRNAEQIKPLNKNEKIKKFGIPEEDYDSVESEIEEIGWEYLIFIKSTDPREVKVPQGEAKYKSRDEWEEGEFVETNVTNLSSMIQIAFAMYHTVLKEDPEDGPKKNKILGFVDSIDSVKRLADYIQSAERGKGVEGKELFNLRSPEAFLGLENDKVRNPDCPKELFRGTAADHERALCEPLPPNKHLNPCPVYEAGECWWTMTEELDLEPMNVYLHKSGRTETPDGDKATDDQWDLMVTTSALEVGFDHPGIIATFQYRAPMNIPGFVQRKGRGGRDPDDQPISVVVLGSRPEDAFYFHHQELLADPDDRYLTIGLDEENEFIQTEHMVSAIFDYFNLTDHDSAKQIYKRLDIDELSDRLNTERHSIKDWLNQTFPGVEDDRLDRVLKEIQKYIVKARVPVGGSSLPIETEPFWKVAQIQKGSKLGDLKGKVDDLQYHRRLMRDLLDEEFDVKKS